MTLKFKYIFTGRARRRVETKDQRLVEQFTRERMTQLAHGSRSRVGECPRDRKPCRMRLGAADAYDGDGSRRTAARQCENRVGQGAASAEQRRNDGRHVPCSLVYHL